MEELKYHGVLFPHSCFFTFQEVPLFKPDDHLLKLLKVAPLKRLQYVAVEGTAGPE